MAGSVTLTFVGLERINAKLQALAGLYAAEFGHALRAEAELEMTEAKRRTPVDTGALKASGHVTGPTYGGRNITVMMKFGGPAAPYAVAVHEDEEVFHNPGQAKFLESVLKENARFFVSRVAARASNTIIGV